MAERYRVTINGKRLYRSHAVWNAEHPDDLVLPGEIVHHQNENKADDVPENLEKMADVTHRSLHSHVGIAALAKWKKENPEKARLNSHKNATKLQKYFADNPEKKLEMEKKRREATIKANKKRKGEVRPFSVKKSETMKQIWKKRKEVVPNEG